MKKYNFFCQQVKFLRHVITREGVATDEDKIKKVMDWTVLHSIKGTQAFLGLANCYRRYVKNFAQIEQPLSKKLYWSLEAAEAFRALKNKLCTSPKHFRNSMIMLVYLFSTSMHQEVLLVLCSVRLKMVMKKLLRMETESCQKVRGIMVQLKESYWQFLFFLNVIGITCYVGNFLSSTISLDKDK